MAHGCHLGKVIAVHRSCIHQSRHAGHSHNLKVSAVFREIPSPGNSRRPACPAFAETLAVISRLTPGGATGVLVTRVGIPRRRLAERQDVRRPIHPGAAHDDELLTAAACLSGLQATVPSYLQLSRRDSVLECYKVMYATRLGRAWRPCTSG